MPLRVSPRLAAFPTYVPGLSTSEVLSRYGLESAIKLASNESPFPPVDAVADVIRDGASGLNRYPDAHGIALKDRLAELHGVDQDRIVIGNGTCELILLAGQALLDPGSTVLYATPSFAIYPHLAPQTGAEAVEVPLDADGGHDLDTMAAMVDERTRLIVICNPNNPTGVYRSAAELEGFIGVIPDDVAILIDEAYHDFVDLAEAGRMMSLARQRTNLLVTRTFSKAFGLPGLRVGYGVGSPDWVRALDVVRQPFNTNTLAQAAAVAALGELAEIERRIRLVVDERERLQHELDARGVAFIPSRANFILVGASGENSALYETLLRSGIIVRDGGPLGVPGQVRVTIGTPDQNDAFLAALDVAIQKQPATSSEG